jgi:hypothetical protein
MSVESYDMSKIYTAQEVPQKKRGPYKKKEKAATVIIAKEETPKPKKATPKEAMLQEMQELQREIKYLRRQAENKTGDDLKTLDTEDFYVVKYKGQSRKVNDGSLEHHIKSFFDNHD